MKRVAPPLAWIVAAILMMPMGVLAFSAQKGTPEPPRDDALSVARAFLTAPSPTRVRGLMFGMSGGFCSVQGAEEAGDPRILPFAFTEAHPEDFEPYLDEIIALRPDFVLVQAGVLLKQRSSWEVYYRMRRQALRALGAVAPADLWFLGQQRKPLYDRCRNHWGQQERDWRAMLELIAEVRAAPAGDGGTSAAARMVTRLRDADIPVLVFELPANSYSAELRAELALAIQNTLADPAFRHIRAKIAPYPDLLPIEHFYDPLHIRPEGAAVFKPWLQHEIRAVLYQDDVNRRD